MTVIQADIADSGNLPLTGFIQVTLDGSITNEFTGKTYVPKPERFTLVGGGIGFNLEPSDDDRTTYFFEVYETTTYTPAPTPDDPSPSPVTLETLWESFHAVVPQPNIVSGSEVPLKFTELVKQTSITRDAMDASLNAVIRRLTTSTDFWNAANTNLFRVKGVYNAAYAYTQGDVVNFDGSAYVCVSLVALVNQNPIVYPGGWRLLVSKGETGSGTTGSTTPYDPLVWVDNLAPARVAVKNQLELLETKTVVATKAPINSPAFTGTPTRATSPATSDNSSQLADTQFVQALITEVRKALVPVGSIMACPYLSPPTGWIRCDGRTLSRTTYASLFAVLGTTWNTGGEAGTDFRIPDLRGRTIQGLDDMGTAQGASGRISPANALASTGGEQKHTMTLAELVSHTHAAYGYSTTLVAAAGSAVYAPNANITANPWTVQNTGSSTPFNVMQPYASFTWIIYTGI